MTLSPNYMAAFPRDTAEFIAAARKHNRHAIANTATGLWLESALRRIEDGVLLSREEAVRLLRYIKAYEEQCTGFNPINPIREGANVGAAMQRLEAKAKEITSAPR